MPRLVISPVSRNSRTIMDPPQNPNSSKPADRKTVERNRRNQMKTLYSRLSSLVPNPSHRVSSYFFHNYTSIRLHSQLEAVSLQAQLEGATSYIKNLEAKLEKMKLKKSCLIARGSAHSSARPSTANVESINAPSIDVHVMDSIVHVVLITGLNSRFVFAEAIRVVHEEGAEVVNASFSVIDNTVFHNIHSKIGDEYAPDSTAAAISQRIRKSLCSK